MKLVSMVCPGCGANLEVNVELHSITCNYCGNQFVLDPEIIHVQHDFTEDAGYNFELGRIRAQAETQEQARLAQLAAQERARAEAEEARMQSMAAQAVRKRGIRKMRWLFILGLTCALSGLLLINWGALSNAGAVHSYMIYGLLCLIPAIVCVVFLIRVNARYRLHRQADWIVIIIVVALSVFCFIGSIENDDDNTAGPSVEQGVSTIAPSFCAGAGYSDNRISNREDCLSAVLFSYPCKGGEGKPHVHKTIEFHSTGGEEDFTIQRY